MPVNLRILLVWVALPWFAAGQDALVAEGQKQYARRCALCHGGDAQGGERGPSITGRVALHPGDALDKLIRQGIPAAGMPPTEIADADLKAMTAYLRTLRQRRGPQSDTFALAAGGSLTGVVRNRSDYDAQVQTSDGRIRLLRPAGVAWREVDPSQGRDWITYHGDVSGNRHSPLDQIRTDNVKDLRMAWVYGIPGARRLQVTPIVVGGVMYVTYVNEVHALDAGSGRVIWQYRRERTPGVIGDAGSGINRGVAISGDRLLMVTDHAHLIALNRWTGALLWDTEMADFKEHYGSTSAPLVVGDLVVAGVSGGDEGIRGFLSAYKISNGERVWKFWTVPAPGEPLADTWKGTAIEHGCAATWLTGTYDPGLNLLYWTAGNPCPDYNGDGRVGDNLYSDSVLAFRPETGKLVWHFQYTPHDLHDWDAQQTAMLIDTEFQGWPRKLLAQANRNGFFYVLDRATGELLLAKPFVRKLTWAKEIGKDGRPVVNPEAIPTVAGVKACPAVEGATNWFSTAFHPGLRLFFLQTLEKCNIYSKAPGKWEQGKSYYDGTTRDVPGEKPQKILRALRIDTGEVAWEHPQTGPADSWGGVLSTAGGVVFFGEDGGAFAAVDATNGLRLWQFQTNQLWKASPMTYRFDGKQYVAIASGGNILTFSLP